MKKYGLLLIVYSLVATISGCSSPSKFNKSSGADSNRKVAGGFYDEQTCKDSTVSSEGEKLCIACKVDRPNVIACHEKDTAYDERACLYQHRTVYCDWTEN